MEVVSVWVGGRGEGRGGRWEEMAIRAGDMSISALSFRVDGMIVKINAPENGCFLKRD